MREHILQAIECQQNQRNGFVTFKAQAKKTHQIIPQHLVANLAQRSAPPEKVAEATIKSSADHLSEVDRLKEEMAKVQSDREQKLLELKTRQQRLAPPPPPVVDFRKQR